MLAFLRRLPEVLADAYLEWYCARYLPAPGDMVTNVRDMWVMASGRITLYSAPGSLKLPVGTPMVCLGHTGRQPPHDPTHMPRYVMRLSEQDAMLPDQLVVYIRIESRSLRASG